MMYRIVTYDRATERMKGSLIVPPSMLGKVKKIAGFQPQDDGLGEYPLDEKQAQQVAKILGFGAEPTRFFYYMEPYDTLEDDGFGQQTSRSEGVAPAKVISDDIQALSDAISEMPEGIVVFDGFQGAGKSTQAEMVGKRLGYPHIDVDDYLGIVRSDPESSHDDLIQTGISKLRATIQAKLKSHRLVLVSTIRGRQVAKLLKVRKNVRYVYVESYLDTPILEREVIEYHIDINPRKNADLIYRRKAVELIEAVDELTAL